MCHSNQPEPKHVNSASHQQVAVGSRARHSGPAIYPGTVYTGVPAEFEAESCFNLMGMKRRPPNYK